MNNLSIPRLMITAPQSGSGKTTITCAILRALVREGRRAASFKSGPDYIDPMFHSRILGAQSHNLDQFLLPPETLKYLAARSSKDADIAVFEGAMGYYDGIGRSVEASAYTLSRLCAVPSVLVINGRGSALSMAAIIKGFRQFRPDGLIRGVIINHVSEMTYRYYKKALEDETGIPCLGYFPERDDCHLESRHLGLITAGEITELQALAERLADQAQKSLDWAGLWALARTAPSVACEVPQIEKEGRAVIAVAMDKAFCFYYEDTLNLFRMLGADIAPFSPLEDDRLPECDGLYLGGGYPELYAGRLSANRAMRKSIKEALDRKLPCIAECGGFMYLHEKFRSDDGTIYPWIGTVPGTVYMTDRLTRFGYVTLTAKEDNLLCRAGEDLRAHEFHYSDSTDNGCDFMAVKASGKASYECGYATPDLYGAYPHLHLWSNPAMARSFLGRCRQYRENQKKERN